jgi:hypothetical protein
MVELSKGPRPPENAWHPRTLWILALRSAHGGVESERDSVPPVNQFHVTLNEPVRAQPRLVTNQDARTAPGQ